jgi:hypothetical protein
LAIYRDGLCPKCGMELAVCTSHEDTGPEFSVRVRRCRATDAKLVEMAERKPDRPEALLVAVQSKGGGR